MSDHLPRAPLPAILSLGLCLSVASGCMGQAGDHPGHGLSCSPPTTPKLEQAVAESRHDLSHGCQVRFDAYLTRLLETAEGDPKPANKRVFSEFLLWATDVGLLSKRQAQSDYNRYFSVKFVTLMGDYDNCSYTCPRKHQLVQGMQEELRDKELGLLRVSRDAQGYYRADRLFQETELVIEATCTACGVPTSAF